VVCGEFLEDGRHRDFLEKPKGALNYLISYKIPNEIFFSENRPDGVIIARIIKWYRLEFFDKIFSRAGWLKILIR